MKKNKDKDPAAVKLGQKRWNGISTKERTAAARRAANARWTKKQAEAKRP
jgi:hypothetical protein